jgi:hypothetical protein
MATLSRDALTGCSAVAAMRKFDRVGIIIVPALWLQDSRLRRYKVSSSIGDTS